MGTLSKSIKSLKKVIDELNKLRDMIKEQPRDEIEELKRRLHSLEQRI